MSKPILAIMGVTGQQGRSVLTYFRNHHTSTYSLRALVRKLPINGDPEVEYVEADYSDKESLIRAFEGTSAIFGMTSGDGSFQGLEFSWGKNIGDAVKATKSNPILVFSSAPDTKKLSHGEIDCYNYRGKADAQEYISKLPGVKSIFVWPGMFMQNFTTYLPPVEDKENAEGVVFAAPMRADVELPWIDIDELGKLLSVILHDKEIERYLGRTIQLAAEWLTYPELVNQWSAITGTPARFERTNYNQEHGRKPGEPAKNIGQLLDDMHRFINQWGYYGGDLKQGQVVETAGWKEFVRRNWDSNTEGTQHATPAARALAAYYACFDPKLNKDKPLSQLWDLFEENATVEFPYAEGPRSLLNGKSAIKAYFSTWPEVFEFHSWKAEGIHANKEGNVAYGRFEAKGGIKTTGKAYHQKYVGVVYTGAGGKIQRYIEYWNPLMLDAMTGDGEDLRKFLGYQ